MALLESLATQLVPLNQYENRGGATVMICRIPVIYHEFERQDESITREPNSLTIGSLDNVLRHMYEGPEYTLEQTIAAISGGDTNLQRLRMGLYQGGHKAYIIFNEVVITDHPEPYYFITYLARGKEGTKLGQEADADFDNLKYLSQKVNEAYHPEVREQYNVISPYAQGVTPNGYPFFTMPFSSRQGEVHLHASPVALPSGKEILLYNYKYAFPYTPDMEYANHMQDKLGGDVVSTRARELIKAGITDDELFMQLLQNTPAYKNLLDQHLNLLTANAMVYAATHQFPKEYSTNAGDWTGDIRDLSLSGFTLITARGGLEDFPNDDAWIQRMKNQNEGVLIQGRRKRVKLSPFKDLSDEIYYNILTKVRGWMENRDT